VGNFDVPGAGAVISFDGCGQAVALTTGAYVPGDLFTPMHDGLTQSDRAPQCVRVRCESCGKIGLLPPSIPPGMEAICADCRLAAELDGQIAPERDSRSPRERWRSYWHDSGLLALWPLFAGTGTYLGLLFYLFPYRNSDYVQFVIFTISLIMMFMPVWVAYLLPSHKQYVQSPDDQNTQRLPEQDSNSSRKRWRNFLLINLLIVGSIWHAGFDNLWRAIIIFLGMATPVWIYCPPPFRRKEQGSSLERSKEDKS